MNKIYTVYKAINDGMDFYASSQQHSKFKLNKVASYALELGLIALLSYFAYIWLGDLYDAAGGSTQVLSFLTMTVLNICGLMVLMLSFLWALPCLFFGEDNRILLPLPITPTQLLLAKLAVLYTNMLKIVVCIGIPFFLASGLYFGMGVGYYLSAALVTLVIPCVPLAFSVLVDIFIMRIFRVKMNKDIISFISTVLMIALVIVFNAKSGSMGMNDLSKFFNPKMTGVMQVLLPNINPSIKLLEGQWLNVLWLAVVVAGCLFAVLFLGGRAFYTSLSTMQDSFGYKKRSADKAEKTGRRSPAMAYLDKEWKMLVRTTSNWTFIFLMGVYMPVVFMGMLLFNGNMVTAIRAVQFNDFAITVTFWIFIGVMAYQAGLTQAGLTVISREGKNAFVMKYLPIPMKTQLWMKFLTCLSAFVLPVLLLMGTLIYVARPPVLLCVHLGVCSVLTVVFATLAEMYYDIKRPKLTWMSENQLFNGYRMILPLLIFIVLFALLCIGLYTLKLTGYTGIMVFDLVLLLLSGLFYRLVMREDALNGLDL